MKRFIQATLFVLELLINKFKKKRKSVWEL